ncbi:hypothetical protein HIM_08355 [Hirsutella minnesotensis 3608]|uniref:Putative peptidase domain-containing protein n=1 Tax=Hirsutella minnesotensis 3608 TaxID=1043627 RepID=A0A0F7ZSZ3_9HYPO|nr:hypothetical protein HIM_08355 [Hirsutella minnesotensis 3608]
MMISLFTISLLLGASATPLSSKQHTATALKAPVGADKANDVHDWSEGWNPTFPIHQSCNSTLRTQLQQGLDETIQLAQHARDHLLRWGNESEFKRRYFGKGPTAVPIGWYDRIISANKEDMLFRCDDPDGVCKSMPSWAGHWRGENATAETVICPLSFAERRPLSSVCNLGYTVATSKRNIYWAMDLMHRVLHVPTISEELVEHHTEDYAGVIKLAKQEPSKSGYDSNTLQYFAMDVWAYERAAPGVGCTGRTPKAKPTSIPSPVSTPVPSPIKTAASECHTHADGVVHCT